MNGACIKMTETQQAKIYNSYKTTKLKLLKRNAAIWFNKICKSKHLTPKYFFIKFNGNNKKTKNIRKAATRCRIKKGIKFYIVKNKNQMVYCIIST